MISNAYPNATKKESVYVTNGSLNEILNLQQFTDTKVSTEKSISVVTALSSSLLHEEILDYAYRPINTNSMLFDIYSQNIGYEDANHDFMSVVNQLGSRFIVMDLNGDPNSPAVKGLIDECDVVLYLFKPTKVESEKASKYLEGLSDDDRLKTKLVCSLWDDMGIKKKTVQEMTKIRSNSILWFPYHTNIQRTMFEGRLCVLNRLMIEGRDQCVSLRQPIKDILSFICDTKSIKVIREVNKWEL